MPLKRALGLPFLTFYGLGTILGAGIYVLIGEVVGQAGYRAPLSFLLAGIVAAFTAFSYAELGSRFPASAGEPVFAQEGIGIRWVAQLCGFMIISVGIVSSATIINGVVGYAERLLPWPEITIKLGLLSLLVGLAIWGIRESVAIAAIITCVEVAGLLLVIVASTASVPSWGEALPQLLAHAAEPVAWSGVCFGAFLAFYAFIGFEDMVNLAEEVHDPERTVPRGIILALCLSVILYLLVSVTVLLVLPADTLARSRAPLAAVIDHALPRAGGLMTAISVLAVVNGALAQVIMASRVLYGMGDRGLLSRWMGITWARTMTPVPATLLAGSLAAVLACFLPLVFLAQATSYITLAMYALMNLSLLLVKRRTPRLSGIEVPMWVPLGGMILSLGLLLAQLYFSLLA